MARSQETFSKKEKEKKRKKKRKEKLERRAMRKQAAKENPNKGADMAYIDENGNIVDAPPDPTKKQKIKAEDIVLGAAVREKMHVEPIKKGKVDFFDHDKGFGFIKETVTGMKYFVHVAGCVDEITQGDKVNFEIQQGRKGMECHSVVKI